VKHNVYAKGMCTNMLYLKRFASQSDTIENATAVQDDTIEYSDVICTYDVFRTRLLNQLESAKDNMMSLSDIVIKLVSKQSI
jgi:hypothetical protein